MAITQRPLALRRDLIRIFGEDRLVAVIRTGSPQIALQAARAMSEAGVRLVEITLTVPDAFEIIEELALDDPFGAPRSIWGAGTVRPGGRGGIRRRWPAHPPRSPGARRTRECDRERGALPRRDQAPRDQLVANAARSSARQRRLLSDLRFALPAPRHLLPQRRPGEPHGRRSVALRPLGRWNVRVDRRRRVGSSHHLRARDPRR